MEKTDLIIVGGGLAGGLAAYRLATLRPELRVLVLEKGGAAGGNHTWSFHESDLTPSELEWVRPFISRSWPGHSVAFPALRRSFSSHYHSIRSEHFHDVLRGALGERLRFGQDVTALMAHTVQLASGALAAGAVIDARGFSPKQGIACGFQKFLGLDLRLKGPHGLTEPVLMDACCEQKEGFRFFYLLPWNDRELLIEDTRYCGSAAIDRDGFRDEIRAFAASRGWEIEAEIREESAALPIPLRAPARVEASGGVPAIGVRGGFFQATTGYSLAGAVRVADRLAAFPSFAPKDILTGLELHAKEGAMIARFHRALNRMLFHAAAPDSRYRVLQRFYALPEPLILRFYSGRSTLADCARILSGRPPVPVTGAIRSILNLHGTPKEAQNG